ncbi:MAG: glycosyl hydrolase family 65 protein [Carnobacterium sp.]
MNQFLKGTEWEIREENIDSNTIVSNETLFSLGNGHIGTRGSVEEGFLNKNFTTNEGTYVNGFFESAPITYGESAYGYAKNTQTICQIPNGKEMSFAIDGEWFHLEKGRVSKHERILNMKEGTLKRSFTWESPNRKVIDVVIERFISYDIPEILAISYKLTPINFNGEIKFKSVLDGNVSLPSTVDSLVDDPRVIMRKKRDFRTHLVQESNQNFLVVVTKESNLRLVVGQEINNSSSIQKWDYIREEEHIISELTIECVKGKTEKIVVFTGYSSFYSQSEQDQSYIKELEETLQKVKKLGYENLKQKHLKTMESFWNKSDIQIKGDNLLQKGLRFNLFHLNQAAGRDGLTNIPAKGLTGDGYEGHYFWDTEMYMLPFFVYTQPTTAKSLLLYRYSILEKARNRARELGVEKGALFPWRTINGEECSAYYPAGTAQFHINADISYGVKLYLEATNDLNFKYKEGFEILVETARFWIEFGDFIPEKENAFCINGVTGPDEYTAIVNNNYYTNLMVKTNLEYAVEVANEVLKNSNKENKKIAKKLFLKDNEVYLWKLAAEKINLPYDEKKRLTKQDDTFFDKAIWDFKNTPKDKYPLLQYYHPLIIYRYQVNKQADVVLAQLLHSNQFSIEQKRRDYNYYESITTHDSSLSRSIFGMMASEIGEKEKAYHYFMDTALMDLSNQQGNTKDGIHAANMGGTWMSMVYGFAGMSIQENEISFSPRLPKEWNELSFKIHFKDSWIRIRLFKEKTIYELISGDKLSILQNNKSFFLEEYLVILNID